MPKMKNGGVTMIVDDSRVSTLRDGGWTVVGGKSDKPDTPDKPDEVIEPAEPTNAEIRAEAEAEGIDLGKAKNKADMLAVIDAHFADAE